MFYYIGGNFVILGAFFKPLGCMLCHPRHMHCILCYMWCKTFIIIFGASIVNRGVLLSFTHGEPVFWSSNFPNGTCTHRTLQHLSYEKWWPVVLSLELRFPRFNGGISLVNRWNYFKYDESENVLMKPLTVLMLKDSITSSYLR